MDPVLPPSRHDGTTRLLRLVKVSSNPADMTKCDETLMGVDYVNLPKVVEIYQRASLLTEFPPVVTAQRLRIFSVPPRTCDMWAIRGPGFPSGG